MREDGVRVHASTYAKVLLACGEARQKEAVYGVWDHVMQVAHLYAHCLHRIGTFVKLEGLQFVRLL